MQICGSNCFIFSCLHFCIDTDSVQVRWPQGHIYLQVPAVVIIAVSKENSFRQRRLKNHETCLAVSNWLKISLVVRKICLYLQSKHTCTTAFSVLFDNPCSNQSSGVAFCNGLPFLWHIPADESCSGLFWNAPLGNLNKWQELSVLYKLKLKTAWKTFTGSLVIVFPAFDGRNFIACLFKWHKDGRDATPTRHTKLFYFAVNDQFVAAFVFVHQINWCLCENAFPVFLSASLGWKIFLRILQTKRKIICEYISPSIAICGTTCWSTLPLNTEGQPKLKRKHPKLDFHRSILRTHTYQGLLDSRVPALTRALCVQCWLAFCVFELFLNLQKKKEKKKEKREKKKGNKATQTPKVNGSVTSLWSFFCC